MNMSIGSGIALAGIAIGAGIGCFATGNSDPMAWGALAIVMVAVWS